MASVRFTEPVEPEWAALPVDHDAVGCVAGDFNANIGGPHYYGSTDSKLAIAECLAAAKLIVRWIDGGFDPIVDFLLPVLRPRRAGRVASPQCECTPNLRSERNVAPYSALRPSGGSARNW